jgi:NAD(P)-dependent dehydrogenase (short-subunit alcohol dehydrogenase family)
MKQAFEGKVAIVTGASAGLGAATALQFAREGARVVVAARREDAGEAVVRQIEALGGEGLFVRTDVTHTPDVVALVKMAGTLASKALGGLGTDGGQTVSAAEIAAMNDEQFAAYRKRMLGV